jgi:ABC-type glycerol-3-phosphate transport system substrate-binding protein
MKTLTKTILAALIAALVLTACSNSSDSDSKTTTPKIGRAHV